MKSIVAITFDQSPNHTGWAIGRPMDLKPLFGKFPLPPWGDDEPERVTRFFLWLMEKIKTHSITHMFYELDVPRSGAGKAVIGSRGKPVLVNLKDPSIVRNQNAMITIIWLCAGLNKIPVRAIDVNMMRDRFLGRRSIPGLQGDAHRKELKLAAIKSCALRGWLVEDDNVAEALGHLDFGLSSLDPRGHGAMAGTHMSKRQISLWAGAV